MLENTLDDNGISVVNGKTDVLPVDNSAVNGKSDASEGISKDLFDANFLQNFSFSPTLTLNNLTDNLDRLNNKLDKYRKFYKDNRTMKRS